jgi:hypothetical protein
LVSVLIDDTRAIAFSKMAMTSSIRTTLDK